MTRRYFAACLFFLFYVSACNLQPSDTLPAILRLGLLSSGGGTPGCSAATGRLLLRDVYQDNTSTPPFVPGAKLMDGLDEAFNAALSPDGYNLYSTSQSSNTLLAFSRNPVNGELTLLQTFQNTGGTIPGAVLLDGLTTPGPVTVSADGRNVYMAAWGDGTLLVFSRNTDTGKLDAAPLEIWQDAGGTIGDHLQDGISQPFHIRISPDDKNLYLTGTMKDALLVFDRNVTDGSLSLNQAFSDVGGTIGTNLEGLSQPMGVDVSPGGESVYITGATDNTLLVFARDGQTGQLILQQSFSDLGVGIGNPQDGLDTPVDVKVSLDGKNVYVVSLADAALLVFSRDTQTGNLTFLEAFQDTVFHTDPDMTGAIFQGGLGFNFNLAIAPDDKNLLVTGYLNSDLLNFNRDPETGQLFLMQAFSDQGAGGTVGTNLDGLAAAMGLSFSPDCKNSYVMSLADNAILNFARE